MFHLRLFLILALCGLRVQLAQAEPVDSLAVEAEPVQSAQAELMDSLVVKKQGNS